MKLPHKKLFPRKKLTSLITNEECKKKIKNENSIFYLKHKPINLTMKTTKVSDNKYKHEIIQNENFPIYNPTYNFLLDKLEKTGETVLKDYSDKKETLSHLQMIPYELDLFGIKRLGRFLTN